LASVKKILSIFIFCIPFLALSQETAILKGRAIDQFSQVVANANISIGGTETGTTTDSLGIFSLVVPANQTIKIRASHSSYQTKNLRYYLAPGETKTTILVFKYRVLPEYTVRSRREGEMTLTLEKVDLGDFATTGNFEARLGSELGVTMNNELSSAFNVRGGNFEENLIYVNDIEVYRPFLASSGPVSYTHLTLPTILRVHLYLLPSSLNTTTFTLTYNLLKTFSTSPPISHISSKGRE